MYSSDAKTYWNERVLDAGTKSNSSTAASLVVYPPVRVSRFASPGVLLSPVIPSSMFGPTTLAMSPELNTMPESNPITLAAPDICPAATSAPVNVTLETLIPPPRRTLARSAGVRGPDRSSVTIVAAPASSRVHNPTAMARMVSTQRGRRSLVSLRVMSWSPFGVA